MIPVGNQMLKVNTNKNNGNTQMEVTSPNSTTERLQNVVKSAQS